SAHVEQVPAGIKHYRAGILDAQPHRFIFFERLREGDGDQVITVTRQHAAADGLVLDERDLLLIHTYISDLELLGELKNEGPLPGGAWSERELGFGGEIRRRFGLRLNVVIRKIKARR